MNYIYSAIGGLILVFIFFFFRKPNNGKADYLLIALNIALGLFLLSDVLVNWSMNSFTLIFQNSMPLLLFPVFIFYALQFTHSNKKLPVIWYGLFIPLFLLLILSITDHFILNTYSSSEILLEFNNPHWVYHVLFKGSQILFMVILFRLLRQLKFFNYRIKQGLSSTEEIELKWLASFTRIYLYAMFLAFILFLSQNLGWIPFSVKDVYFIIYAVLIIGILLMTYQGIQHYTLDQVMDSNGLLEMDIRIAVQDSVKIQNMLTEEERDFELFMLRIIEKQQLYLNPTLSLRDLALSLNKSPHFVSRIINAQSNRSFYDLINHYRVVYLKKLLNNSANKNFTILALGLDSGFNSKASLNRIFKKHTNLTPKQYLDQIKGV